MSTAVRERLADARPAVPAPGTSALPPADAVPGWALPATVAIGVVLRVWRALSNGLSFDETFTALAGRRPVGDLLSFLRFNDSHPPLDYLLRMPFARARAPDLVLRAPSLVFSCAALALFAWWMRRRGWFGVIATALVAVSGFQIVYGGEARMYALLQLLGVAGAMLAGAWLVAPRRWHAWAVGAVVLVALFDHVSGGLLAVGLLAVAGARTDGDAWRWRAGIGAAGLVWAALWAPSFLDQLGARWASWIPPTTLAGFADTLTRQVTLAKGASVLVIVAVAGGGLLLVRADRVLGRVWLACGALPFAIAAVAGLFAPFLFDRTLTVASWAPVLALAWLLDTARQRWRTAGTALAAIAVIVVASSSVAFLAHTRWEYDRSIGHLERVVRAGDVVAVRPARYHALVAWRIGVRGALPVGSAHAAGVPDSWAMRIGAGPMTGRVWLLTPADDAGDYPGYEACAPRWRDGPKQVLCLRR